MMISEIMLDVHFEHYQRDGMEITWSKRIDRIDMICEAMWKHQRGMGVANLAFDTLHTSWESPVRNTSVGIDVSRTMWNHLLNLMSVLLWNHHSQFLLGLFMFVHTYHPFIKHVWKIQKTDRLDIGSPERFETAPSAPLGNPPAGSHIFDAIKI